MTESELEALKEIERAIGDQRPGTALAKLTALIERGVTEGEAMVRDLMTPEDWNDRQNDRHEEEDLPAAEGDPLTAPFEDPFGPEDAEAPR